MGDHGRMLSSPHGATLRERSVRGGTQILINVTRRTITRAQPTDGSRRQRVTAFLVLMPLLVVVLLFATILFVVLVLVLALAATGLFLAAFVARRRFRRAS
jgi:Flp pilus assembly protein TadB